MFTLGQHMGSPRAALSSNVATNLDTQRTDAAHNNFMYKDNTHTGGANWIYATARLGDALTAHYADRNRMYKVTVTLIDRMTGYGVTINASKLSFSHD